MRVRVDIGEQVLAWFNERGNLIPARADHESRLAALTPVLYCSINKS